MNCKGEHSYRFPRGRGAIKRFFSLTGFLAPLLEEGKERRWRMGREGRDPFQRPREKFLRHFAAARFCSHTHTHTHTHTHSHTVRVGVCCHAGGMCVFARALVCVHAFYTATTHQPWLPLKSPSLWSGPEGGRGREMAAWGREGETPGGDWGPKTAGAFCCGVAPGRCECRLCKCVVFMKHTHTHTHTHTLASCLCLCVIHTTHRDREPYLKCKLLSTRVFLVCV